MEAEQNMIGAARSKIKEEAQNGQKLEDEIMEFRASSEGRGGSEAGLLWQASATAGSGRYEPACCARARWQPSPRFFPRLGGDICPSSINDTGRASRASSHDASGVAQAEEEQQRAAERVCGLPVPSCVVGLGKLSGPRSGEGRRDANSPTAPLSH